MTSATCRIARRRDVPLLLLHDVERRDDGRPAVLRRVVRGHLLEAFAVGGREGERLALVPQLALRHVQPRLVVHLRVEAHRSTSPITTSIDPMTAITSAIIPPTIICGSAWHAISDGERIFTRHGRFVPSDTT